MKSDYQETGKLYPKLDSLAVLQRPECKGVEIYLGSSCQFRTQKKYKAWLLNQEEFKHLKIKIVKGE